MEPTAYSAEHANHTHEDYLAHDNTFKWSKFKRSDMINIRENIYDSKAFVLRLNRDPHPKPKTWPERWS
jgi:hypothetical protein